jgi:thymidylate kinase
MTGRPMMSRPFIVGIEGPCCAGKTTLGHALLDELEQRLRLAYIRDYADWVGGGRHLPPPNPGSLADEQAALRQLLAIEADRSAAARAEMPKLDLILIDRSVHTLAAHCAGLTALTGLDHDTTGTRVIHSSDAPLWPDLVLYLDVDQATVASRNNGKFAPDSLFIDALFNSGVRSYFERLALQQRPRVDWLDANHGARLLHRQASQHLMTTSVRTQTDKERL